MAYLSSIVVVVIGLLVVAAAVARLLRSAREFDQTGRLVSTNIHNRAGLLRARIAAVRVAIAQRHERFDNGQPRTSNIASIRR